MSKVKAKVTEVSEAIIGILSNVETAARQLASDYDAITSHVRQWRMEVFCPLMAEWYAAPKEQWKERFSVLSLRSWWRDNVDCPLNTVCTYGFWTTTLAPIYALPSARAAYANDGKCLLPPTIAAFLHAHDALNDERVATVAEAMTAGATVGQVTAALDKEFEVPTDNPEYWATLAVLRLKQTEMHVESVIAARVSGMRAGALSALYSAVTILEKLGRATARASDEIRESFADLSDANEAALLAKPGECYGPDANADVDEERTREYSERCLSHFSAVQTFSESLHTSESTETEAVAA